jgi:hypothetical protein
VHGNLPETSVVLAQPRSGSADGVRADGGTPGLARSGAAVNTVRDLMLESVILRSVGLLAPDNPPSRPMLYPSRWCTGQLPYSSQSLCWIDLPPIRSLDSSH